MARLERIRSLAAIGGVIAMTLVPSLAKADTQVQARRCMPGATFPRARSTAEWFKDYNAQHPEVVVEYQPIGSGGGIKQFTAGTVDFGASDAPRWMTRKSRRSRAA